MSYLLSILFTVRKSKGKLEGYGGIYCRITVNGKRTEISVGRKVLTSKWDASAERVKGISSEAREINELLTNIRSKLLEKQSLLICHKGL